MLKLTKKPKAKPKQRSLAERVQRAKEYVMYGGLGSKRKCGPTRMMRYRQLLSKASQGTAR